MHKLKIIGIMDVFNEADIVNQTITWMIQQGISLIIIDNNSTDGSLEIERQFIGRGVLEVQVLASESFDLSTMLTEGYRRAVEYSPDWIVLVDADEFLEAPMPNKDLAEAIQAVDGLGYNLIQFNGFEFLLTEKDYHSSEPDVRKRLRYYTWCSDFYFRAWKHYADVDLLTTAGHKPIFPQNIEERVFPAKFVLRHYKFRSLQHGLRKVFKERLPRYSPRERAKGWHQQYDKFKPDPSYFIVDSLDCNWCHEDGKWNLEKKIDTYFGAWKPPNANEHPSTLELSKKMDTVSADLQRQFDAIYQSPPVRLYLALRRLLHRI